MIHPNDQSNPNYKTKQERLTQTWKQFLFICILLFTGFSAIGLISLSSEYVVNYGQTIIDNREMASVDNKPLETGIVEAHFEREHVQPRFFTDTVTHSYHIEVDGVEYELDVSLWSKLEKGQEIEYQITDKGRLVNVEPIQATGLDDSRESNQLSDMN